MGTKAPALIRAVLDTNVVVSALLFRGAASRLVAAWQGGRFRPLVSREIVLEYSRVLAYPKFHLEAKAIRALLQEEILPFVETVEVTTRKRVVREDPSDDEFLACAVTARADFLVSGDAHLLALGPHERIPIGSPAAFLEFLERGA